MSALTEILKSRDHNLVVYGSLAPGCENHHELSDLTGIWIAGHVRGELQQLGWGADIGFPGIRLSPEAALVAVQVFSSADLPAHWARLDDFEGDGYQRVEVTVETETGNLSAWIYEARLPQ